jgi:hypothetical protein
MKSERLHLFEHGEGPAHDADGALELLNYDSCNGEHGALAGQNDADEGSVYACDIPRI